MKVIKVRVDGFLVTVLCRDDEGQHVAVSLPIADFLEGRTTRLTLAALGDDIDHLTDAEKDERAANVELQHITIPGFGMVLH